MKIITRRPGSLRRLCIAMSPLFALAGAQNQALAREGNVFSLTLAESLQYDTNLFRIAPEADNRATLGSDRRDDFISSTTVALNMSKQLGRHTIYGDLSRSFVLFQEFTRLNYTAENSQLGWSGSFGAGNSWDTYFKRTATQSDFADLQSNVSNVVTTDTLGATLLMRVAKEWVLRPAISRESYSNTAAQKQSSDGTARILGLNMGYRPYSGNVVEAQYRHVNRDYDSGSSGFRQDEVGLFGTWLPGGDSSLDARVALLQQETNNGQNNGSGNFHQVVGFINPRWRVSGASLLSFKVFREISTINIGTDQDAVARGVTTQWTWTPLAKVKFDTSFDYRNRNFPNANIVDPSNPATRIGVKDRTRTFSVGATYSPTQSSSIQATARRERRHAEPASRSYDANVYSVIFQYTF